MANMYAYANHLELTQCACCGKKRASDWFKGLSKVVCKRCWDIRPKDAQRAHIHATVAKDIREPETLSVPCLYLHTADPADFDPNRKEETDDPQEDNHEELQG